MRIQVIHFDGSQYSLDINEYDTLEYLKEKIGLLTGMNNENFTLIRDDRPLRSENDKLDIYHGCTIFALFRQNGGGGSAFEYLDVEKGQIKQEKVGSDGPERLVVQKGINIEGKCQNKSCEVYDQRVICPINQKTYDFIKEKDKIRCPICDQLFISTNCGFYKCAYRFKGTKYDKKNKINPIQEIDKKRSTSSDQYESFDEYSTEKTTWISLIVEVEMYD